MLIDPKNATVRITSPTHAFALMSYAMAFAFGIVYTAIDTTTTSMMGWLGGVGTDAWSLTMLISSTACFYGAALNPTSRDPEGRRMIELAGCIFLGATFFMYEYSLVRNNGFFTFPATEILAFGFGLGAYARAAQLAVEQHRIRAKRLELAAMMDKTGTDKEA